MIDANSGAVATLGEGSDGVPDIVCDKKRIPSTEGTKLDDSDDVIEVIVDEDDSVHAKITKRTKAKIFHSDNDESP